MSPRSPSVSKDYWDLIFERLARRKLFCAAIALLALLYASAIYAPLVANDRPYVLKAIDFRAYEQARAILVPATIDLAGLVVKTPEEYLTERGEGSEQTYEQALETQVRAVRNRLEILRIHLSEEKHAELASFLGDVERAVELARERGSGALELAARLRERAQSLRDALAPTAVELRGVVSYPLFEALGGIEVCFMVLWAFVLAFPLWNHVVNRRFLAGERERIRRARRRKLAWVLVSSLAAGGLWEILVGGEMTFHSAPFKEALTRGDIVATRVVFPPIALGFAETHLAERFRPPTWTPAARRSDGEASEPDRVTGFRPDPTPVDVRAGEPARDSPWRHVLGTDSLGRDLLVRILWGGRVSLAVGLLSTAVLMTIGVVVGALAGYLGGRVDFLISRAIEIVMCFPVFFLILVVVAFIGPSILSIMIVIGCLRWTGVARLARGEFLRLQSQDFVVAARAAGLSTSRIVFRHVLPNAIGPLLVAASFSVAAGLLIESGLSFLGFGIQAPIPSWGALINESRSAEHWWIHVFPGLLIFVTVLCTNLVGDAVLDAMDPKSSKSIVPR